MTAKLALRPSRFRPVTVTAGIAALALGLAACGGASGTDDTEENPGSGSDNADVSAADGVPAGASKEDYVAALADIDDVELTMQLASSPENAYSVAAVEYAETVEEWSGGKITFEIFYSASRVPTAEMSTALGEGLIDMGQHLPFYEPDAFPINDYATTLMYLHEGNVLPGSLQYIAAWTEIGAASTELTEEFRGHGIQPLLPLAGSGSNGLICTGDATSLEDIAGMQVRAGSTGIAAELTALGAVPVTVPAAELYEGLQRGIVDCAAQTPAGASVFGFHEVTDSWTLDNRVNFSGTPVGFSINAAKWDSLPLAAQQLLWDKLDGLLEGIVADNILGANYEALKKAVDAGLTINAWDDDAAQALQEFNHGRTAELPSKAPAGIDGEAFVQNAVDVHEKWQATLEELGLGQEVGWEEFVAWYESNDVDMEAFTQAITDEALAPNRPE
ncbi:TRAP transporter substrate-binding protein DctP [Georgenia sp. AZ-5]|uniref:TRAP transporter substrate-binding protein DctP n=1 Tax=Georgenia sp. AZ-5 TaxID=3367526 RepID=UPI00375401EC